jgi:hypothetical protein
LPAASAFIPETEDSLAKLGAFFLLIRQASWHSSQNRAISGPALNGYPIMTFDGQ